MRKAMIIILVWMAAVVVPACNYLGGSQESPPAPIREQKILTFSPLELPAARMGKPYQVRIDIGNVETFAGQFEVQEGQLPPGLNLERVKSENAVMITGVPEAEGQYPFILFVQCMGTNDPGQEGKIKYSIEVEPAS